MASIPPPNYTQIPNVIFDYWMNILTPGEFKVLLCICRKTFGWQKSSDQISARQIVEMTGLSKHGIKKTLDKLIEHGLIHKFQSKTEWGDDAPNEYSIHVEDIKNTRPTQLSCPPVPNSVAPPVGNSVAPQKKDYTKESYTKENTGGGGKKFLSFGEDGNVRLTQQQYENLLKKMDSSERDYWIEQIDLEIGKQGLKRFNDKYKSHYHVILSWKKMREEKGQLSGNSRTLTDKNRILAQEEYENNPRMKNNPLLTVELNGQEVTFIPFAGQSLPIILKFNDRDFSTKWTQALKKYRLI